MNVSYRTSKVLTAEFKTRVPLFKSISAIILLILFLWICINPIIETNKTIRIACDKTRNLCIFGETKILPKTKYITVAFSDVKDVFINTNHGRYENTYDFIIQTTRGDFYLYKDAYGLNYLSKLLKKFNNYKNNPLENNFAISQHNFFFFMLPTFCVFVFLLFLWIFIFMNGYKQSIDIDKEKDLICIKLYRVIWAKVRILKISEIRQLNILEIKAKMPNKGAEILYSINYISIDGSTRKFLFCPVEKDLLFSIYSQINKFLFNSDEQNIVSSENKPIQKNKFDNLPVDNKPLFVTKSPILMGVLAFLTSLFLAAVMKIGFYIQGAGIEVFIVPVAIIFALTLGWRLQSKLSTGYRLKYTACIALLYFLLLMSDYRHIQHIKSLNLFYIQHLYFIFLLCVAIFIFSDKVSESSAKAYIPPDVIPLDIKIKKRIACGCSFGFIVLSLLARILNNTNIISISNNIIFLSNIAIPFVIFLLFQYLLKYSWTNYMPPSEDKDEDVEI